MFKTLANAWKIPDLRRKLLFTLFILVIYRFGAAIEIPYINHSALETWKQTASMSGCGQRVRNCWEKAPSVVAVGAAVSAALILTPKQAKRLW